MLITMFLNLYLSTYAHAVDVAFLEIHDRNGNLTQLEPGGRFMHTAIRIGDRWLHAHPNGGVEFIEDIHEFGDHVFILRNQTVPEPQWNEYQHWLGKNFDFRYSWFDPTATYCSRLVANLLKVDPKPMEFKAEIWRKHVYRNESLGEPGLSPDDLFEILLSRGYRPEFGCERRMEKAS